jgi:hypothetical protein
MHLIIGGAYQGKLDYAKKTYGLSGGDIFDCSEDGLLEYGKCVNHLERFTLYCAKNGWNPSGFSNGPRPSGGTASLSARTYRPAWFRSTPSCGLARSQRQAPELAVAEGRERDAPFLRPAPKAEMRLALLRQG